MGGGGAEVQEKYSRKGKLNEKNSRTPINPKKYSCYGLKKIHTRNLITKKIPAARKFPSPKKNFSMVRPLVSASGANYYNGCQTSNVWRRNMSRSRESRPRGSRKQQTKIPFAARARASNKFKKIIMGHRDSLS